ncbi:NAD(P)H-dependent oxidoreductase [Methylomonas sp. SURF-1]|uniref:NAD(P)H-dependent oxidoreductase n=1 Tax=Methylomonas aurea TaxID=2952224 RepID=A0ABT1UKQ2_9GAMM|nr:NAD(P)H-dependent oxidoreductase [Methylomonas sp. SURF-1]MCQ8182606.1 NAD(P)H-dependent oxidoreductase [Methylomonas sp. SURF-1]
MATSKQDILDAFQFRHACKEFDAERKIPGADFEFILETARLSPSSFGLEPWRFLVVQNPQLREKLRQFTWGGQKQLPTASHVVLTLVRKSHFMRYDSAYLQYMMREVQHYPEDIIQLRSGLIEKFQRSDFDLLGSERTLTDWATRQTYLPLANMMTAAALIGIDSCPIEGFERAEVERILAEQAGVDLDQWAAAYMVAFGYRKNPPPRPKTRQCLEQVVEWLA